jgi:hypothetical protein
MKLSVKMDSDCLVGMLIERLEYWTKDKTVIELFEKMYDRVVDCFNGGDFDVMQIVDNDWVNWCDVFSQGEKEFGELSAVYERQSLGDCSCDNLDCGASFIESVDDDESPTMFLVRY